MSKASQEALKATFNLTLTHNFTPNPHAPQGYTYWPRGLCYPDTSTHIYSHACSYEESDAIMVFHLEKTNQLPWRDDQRHTGTKAGKRLKQAVWK